MSENYRKLCVFQEDEYSRTFCTEKELIEYANNLPPEDYIIHIVPTETLRWSIEPAIELWNGDVLYHLNRIRDASLDYPPIIYDTQVVDGVHRIVKASSLNIDHLAVMEIASLPPLRTELKEPYAQMVSYMNDVADILEQE